MQDKNGLTSVRTRKTARLSLRVQPRLLEMLHQCAESKQKSLAEFCLDLLKTELRKNGYEP